MLDWVKSKINGDISGIGLIVFGVVVLLAKPFATIAAIAAIVVGAFITYKKI